MQQFIELVRSFIDLVLHLDVHLTAMTAALGVWSYVVLFAVIFCETGLVVTPLLPGDSLLFAAGALAALDGSALSLGPLWVLLILAAFLGDNVNYSVGRWLGPKVFSRERSWFLNPEHLRSTQEFYDRHGGRTVFLARFLPILRTFAPFVAGIGRMERKSFMVYSAVGSLVWMSVFLGAGYSFGQIPWVKKNFAALIMAVIVVTLLPAAYAVITQALRKRRGTPVA